jgi:hypothetical protein
MTQIYSLITTPFIFLSYIIISIVYIGFQFRQIEKKMNDVEKKIEEHLNKNN